MKYLDNADLLWGCSCCFKFGFTIAGTHARIVSDCVDCCRACFSAWPHLSLLLQYTIEIIAYLWYAGWFDGQQDVVCTSSVHHCVAYLSRALLHSCLCPASQCSRWHVVEQ